MAGTELGISLLFSYSGSRRPKQAVKDFDDRFVRDVLGIGKLPPVFCPSFTEIVAFGNVLEYCLFIGQGRCAFPVVERSR